MLQVMRMDSESWGLPEFVFQSAQGALETPSNPLVAENGNPSKPFEALHASQEAEASNLLSLTFCSMYLV